jgi:hypothetical protein
MPLRIQVAACWFCPYVTWQPCRTTRWFLGPITVSDGPLGFFDGGRPDSEPDDPCVGTHGKGPLIGEVFVEGHNDGVSVLRPGKDFCIGTSRQGDV